jgi:hypothetical protein
MAGLNFSLASGGKRPRTPLAEISETVADTAEEVLKEAPGTRVEIPFNSQDEAEAFLHDLRSYAAQRTAGKLSVAGNSTKGSKDGTTPPMARFTVEPKS